MDIYTLDKNSIKIHSKHANFIVDPAERGVDPTKLGTKVSCDAVILLNKQSNDLSKVADYRIVINGPGEYEISGAKVSCIKADLGFIYSLMVDGFSVILGSSSEIPKISAIGGSASVHKEEFNTECQIAILNVDDELNPTVVTKLEPKIMILYGEDKEGAVKILGKQNLPTTKKFTIMKDKLPEEMEVVVLG